MRGEAADLRQEIRRRPVLGEGGRGPGAGRIVAAEDARRAAEVPGRGEQQRDRRRQLRAAAVGGEADAEQRRDGEVALAPARQRVVEDMLDPPCRIAPIEDEDRGTLASLVARPVLPIADPGIEPTPIGDEIARLGAAHEAPRRIARSRGVGEGEAVLRQLAGNAGDATIAIAATTAVHSVAREGSLAMARLCHRPAPTRQRARGVGPHRRL